MRWRAISFFCALGVIASASDKKLPATGRGENQDLIVNVTLYYEPAQIKSLLGVELDAHYIIADVKVEPKFGKEIQLDRDDFQLRTDKDGEHTQPFAPNQVAGVGGLVLAHGKSEGAASPGMVLGGPLVLRGPGVGEAGKPAELTEAKPASDAETKKEDPLTRLLREKALPQKKIEQPVSGLLYFPMEKQKLKDLELTYGGRENRIAVRFK